MPRAAEAIARDRGQEFELGSENRFPLDLTSSVESQWAAYETSIVEIWDPEDEELWSGFDSEEFSAEDREAASLVWSHRTWIEYLAIAESEAVLVRACLEPGTEIDFKYCLSMRAVERARSADLSHILAKRLGTYSASPLGPELIALLDGDLVRRALHARCDLDAYVAAHLITQGEIDVAMWRVAAEHTDRVMETLIELVIRDKDRMLDVAWNHFGNRVTTRDLADRSLIAATISDVLRLEELKGRQVPALLAPSVDSERLLAAHDLAARAGLGGIPPARQSDVASTTVTALCARFLEFGVEIDLSE